MATYLGLFKFTQKGAESLKESPGRIDAARQLAKSLGGDLKEVYLAMGQFDLVAFIEAPNDEVVAKVLLATAQRGTVSTQTIRLFSEAEYRKLVADLP